MEGYISFIEDIQRDENSSIAEIVRNLNSNNSKIKDPETPDIIENLRRSNEDVFQYTIYNVSLPIKDASPQFIEDMNVILNAYKNNIFVEYMMSTVVSEFGKDDFQCICFSKTTARHV